MIASLSKSILNENSGNMLVKISKGHILKDTSFPELETFLNISVKALELLYPAIRRLQGLKD